MYDLQEISNKVVNGVPVTTDEYLYFLKHSESARWGFRIGNNPGNIANTLKNKLGYDKTEVGFNPDKVALSAQITMMLQKGDTDDLELVKKNFVLNTDGLDPAFINQVNLLLA